MKLGRVEGGPPRRLLEETAREDLDPGSSTAWAIDLLRSTPPYEPTPGRKQRVRLALGQSTPGRWLPILRPAIVIGVLLGCGAIASAALGDWPRWIARVYERMVGAEPAPASLAGDADRRPRTRRTAVPAGRVESEAEPLPASGPVLPLAAEPPAPAGDSAATAPAVRRPRRSAATPATEPASPVLEAMRALRVDRDPPRARVLLARYLERHPNGALAEEALALSIEAALAHGDPDAAALGGRYLDRYPRGAFQSLARRAVDRGR